MTQRRYEATFRPEAWQDDYAIPVDPEGPTTWDCTEFVTNPPDWCRDYFKDLDATLADEGEFLDRRDVLQRDKAAPAWIRRWRGPFTITVRYAD
jgi:hypothetical protein